MLPNIRLMARAFHRVPCVASTPSTNAVAGSASGMQRRRLSGSVRRAAWEGAQNEDHVTNEGDKHNVQHDTSREGKQERATNQGSRGTTEKSGESNEKAKEEFPEAPDTIGMQDERGGKA